ncbi:cysteine dioxygenase [Polynucleobacter sp. MG-5-Ahmo-C2]|uniref:cysteine dioxygenase family protein n=1 Tax=Polynucleobacter sp. MG-5-Ahmo-C2 TaxID=2081051 RepID=UPI001BFD0269|nr:cysteine dioxygenase [Polynucleobacter sp. MG-5-Ahmo-C2]QWD98042.1 cysteine dioxygenase [Polynucleobacter sp. MG-5-Ahmo-C2]
MNNQTDTIAPLRDFVIGMTHLVSQESTESNLISKGSDLLETLIQTDSWLPEFCTVPHPEFYQQFLLHADPLGRFSVVSFVWGPGQKTPIHDHCIWGLIGMLRGMEKGQRYKKLASGELVMDGPETVLRQGYIEAVSPTIGDIHVVSNAIPDKTSISIHVYGANIGAVKRHTYDPTTGSPKNFVSGYSSKQIPNLWDRSAEIRASL